MKVSHVGAAAPFGVFVCRVVNIQPSCRARFNKRDRCIMGCPFCFLLGESDTRTLLLSFLLGVRVRT